jgi:hypothetical protein
LGVRKRTKEHGKAGDNMDVTIYFKPQSSYEHYRFEEEEFKRFEQDFLNYTQTGTPKGGSYTCRKSGFTDYSEPRRLILKFDEITLT